MTWYVVEARDEYVVTTDRQNRFDHPLYVICKCEVQEDAQHIVRLLNTERGMD